MKSNNMQRVENTSFEIQASSSCNWWDFLFSYSKILSSREYAHKLTKGSYGWLQKNKYK